MPERVLRLIFCFFLYLYPYKEYLSKNILLINRAFALPAPMPMGTVKIQSTIMTVICCAFKRHGVQHFQARCVFFINSGQTISIVKVINTVCYNFFSICLPIFVAIKEVRLWIFINGHWHCVRKPSLTAAGCTATQKWVFICPKGKPMLWIS